MSGSKVDLEMEFKVNNLTRNYLMVDVVENVKLEYRLRKDTNEFLWKVSSNQEGASIFWIGYGETQTEAMLEYLLAMLEYLLARLEKGKSYRVLDAYRASQINFEDLRDYLDVNAGELTAELIRIDVPDF